jgi:hypothetical protein
MASVGDWSKRLLQLKDDVVFNSGNAGRVGAEMLLSL